MPLETYTVDDTDTAGIPAGSTINTVTIRGWYGTTAIGGKYENVIRTGGSNIQQGLVTSTDNQWTELTWDVTGEATWTLMLLDAPEIGYTLNSKTVGPSQFPTWCSQIYAEVDFTAPVANPFNSWTVPWSGSEDNSWTIPWFGRAIIGLAGLFGMADFAKHAKIEHDGHAFGMNSETMLWTPLPRELRAPRGLILAR